ncbi:SDR family NAD(P)-dependent oxidoreductase [Capilliphycus salinus ALCB114379]|uniref:type I polyketide synthase n=1 Tax=Capilliphycus salinus TaxID=2768948 RepID=UPI0039A4F8D7
MNNLSSSERILAALTEARTKLEAVEQEKNERVAIIGMAGRFPGAQTVEQFWENIKNGVNSIQFLSDEELVSSGVSLDEINAQNYVKAYASFDNIEYFDAAFFGYSPREAELIDPQQRIFLECAWEALENAGYDPERYSGKVGVYGGSALNNYIINLYSNTALRKSVDSVQFVVSNVMGLMPTRVSYKLNLKGPSCGIQTGCSTSLVSVHIACQSLLKQECDIALAGGVTVNSARKSGYLYKEDGIASPDGYCRAFDANAKGTVFGNGVGIVVLKRLSKALEDGDQIYAVIRGSAINNDGSQKVGLTAPSVTGQAEVIATAIAKAGVEPETINYIETHGTGTALGDPIEISALTKVFGKSNKKYCAIGSVKSNIGHLDAAAGIVGLIKATLALKNQQIPPSLNFENPNPQINFADSAFYVNTQLSNWQKNGSPRRAGVSSFGMGGTNSHIILEEAPQVEISSNSRPWKLLLLSAKTPSALETATTQLATHLKQHSNLNLADVAYTLQTGRKHHEYRRMLVCKELKDAVETLETSENESQKLLTKFYQHSPQTIVFMFSGQGSQYINMALELYEKEPLFRQVIDECSELIKSHLEQDIRELIYSKQHPEKNLINETTYAQPALFIIEYALAKLWISWGVKPQAMIGHSIGEYVAATWAGVFSLEDALALVATRGKLMQTCPSGAMLSVSSTLEKIQSILPQELVIATINSPNLCVVSGSNTGIKTFEKVLNQQNITYRHLHTSHAFHSPLMEPILDEFQQIVTKINLNPPAIPVLSNVTGTWLTATEATQPEYWVQHLRKTVQFSEGIKQVLQKPNPLLLEVGPGRTLTIFAKQHQPDINALTSLRHPQDKQSDHAHILETLGQLWLSGIEVNWSAFYANERRQRVPLPTYPFERQYYWIEPQAETNNSQEKPQQPQKKSNLAEWFYVPSWKRSTLPKLSSNTERKCWLIFVDEMGLGEKIVQRLTSENQVVAEVRIGEKFVQLTETLFEINPENFDDYQHLIRVLKQNNFVPNEILHFWGSESAYHLSSSLEIDFESYQNKGFYSLLALVQAITQQNIDTPVKLTTVTNNIHDVLGTEPLNPAQVTQLGLCKVIPQEYPHITCKNIDVAVPTNSDLFTTVIDQVIAELQQNSTEPVVAYRDRYRWIPTFESVFVPEPSAKETRLIKNGVYLIAGDLVEGLGLVYAQYLTQELEAKLILVGRSTLPEKHQWEQWLISHGQQDNISQCIRKLQALETSGSEFLFFSADLADETKMQSIVTQADEKFGQINGVIHAGTMGDRSSCPIQDLDLEKCHYQFQMKVRGLITLAKIFEGRKLDFYLLQSSLSSIVGGVGFGAYTAANLFMDAFASQQNKTGSTPWISINWDACQFQEESSSQKTGSALIDLAITPNEVWQVSQRVLSQDIIYQRAVSPRDLHARIEQSIQLKTSENLETLHSNQTEHLSSNHARPHLKTSYTAPRNEIEKIVANAMENLLGIEKVGIYDNFFELGGHSLLAIQIISRLREEFQIDIPMREFLFESPTVAGIAKIIEENKSKQTDDPEIKKLLEEIENLSLEEVESMLSIQGNLQEDDDQT